MQNILPDAVRNNGPANLETGKIDNVLTVNKERIYMAGVGAVKELSGITDNIIDKIDELEQVRYGTFWQRFFRFWDHRITRSS